MRYIYSFKISSFQIIIGSFLAIILLGAFLLMLPISSAEGVVTPFSDALFTSTSAVCVTGLVVHDTYRYWSLFGKTCILVLIQIGGLGTITLAMIVTMLSGRKVSLFQRSVMKDAISADQIGGMGHFSLFILQSTLAAELSGASGSSSSLPQFLPAVSAASEYSIFCLPFYICFLQRRL